MIRLSSMFTTYFNTFWLAESVASLTMNLKVVGSNPTVDKNVSYCIISLHLSSLQLDWAYTDDIKQ